MKARTASCDSVSLQGFVGTVIDNLYRIEEVVQVEFDRILLRARETFDSESTREALLIVDTSKYPGDRFKRFLEAKFLSHPNLIRVFEVGWLDSANQRFPWIATDYPEALGSDATPAPECKSLLRQIAEALSYLHSENLAYCALRAETVWRIGDRWLLSDFSGLCVLGSRSQLGPGRGFGDGYLAYPPERAHGEITAACDIWSLGALASALAKNNSIQLDPVLKALVDSPTVPMPEDCRSPAEILTMLEDPEAIAVLAPESRNGGWLSKRWLRVAAPAGAVLTIAALYATYHQQLSHQQPGSRLQPRTADTSSEIRTSALSHGEVEASVQSKPARDPELLRSPRAVEQSSVTKPVQSRTPEQRFAELPKQEWRRPLVQHPPATVADLAPPPVFAPSSSVAIRGSAVPGADSIAGPTGELRPSPNGATAPKVEFSAAVPIKHVDPVIPEIARPLMREPILLKVEVDVNTEGRVTAARAIGANTSLTRLLSASAAEAAKLWRFQPAKRDGVNTASETVLVFQFAGTPP
jgi:serine/threonine protein kinase